MRVLWPGNLLTENIEECVFDLTRVNLKLNFTMEMSNFGYDGSRQDVSFPSQVAAGNHPNNNNNNDDESTNNRATKFGVWKSVIALSVATMLLNTAFLSFSIIVRANPQVFGPVRLILIYFYLWLCSAAMVQFDATAKILLWLKFYFLRLL